MSNGFFNDDFDSIFRKIFQDMQESVNNGNKKYYINGKEVSPEQLAQLRQQQQQGGNSAEQSARAFQQSSTQGQNDESNYLEQIGRNLTQEARDDLLDPVIGRDKEIQETAEVLSRRTKNNPILVGEAGVGKTAIVEGLAQAIVKGNVPASIKDSEVISVDISSLEAGTQYRGAFEENIQKLVEAVKEAKNVVLFFDEIHQIIGSGSTGGDSGSKGLSDIIKPALSRGEFSIIGATTQDEYRNNILKDAALARRFNEVLVNEPSPDDTFNILKGLREKFEEHHHVELPDDVLKACVDLSIQYIPQRLLPDKAIDVLDITAAHLSAQSPAVDKVEIENRIAQLQDDKSKAVSNEEYKEADKFQKEIKELEDKLENNNGKYNTKATVKDVSDSIERLTGIPVSQMDASDIERLKKINKRLKDKIIGQDKAVDLVSRAIRRNRAGFDEGNRPIGSFLFVGPTGVGKSELAKQLAIDLFGNKEALIRLDMSEYSDQTAVSKMIGTTAGYVGYDDNSNTLTEKVRRNPYSVILFDEIEKANPQILTLLLQVMDDGHLTDGQGNVINFKNTIIICTSNAGFGDGNEEFNDIMDEMKKFFRPEFLNRFNGIVKFEHLDKDALQDIVNLLLEDVQKTLDKKGITINVTQDVKDWLIDKGYDKEMGARPLRRVVEQEVRDKITDYYLDHTEVKHVDIVLENDEVIVKGK
ncbi:AAA family ATPase [Staphylococcus saprophyticus]|uniref:ATP-dependent Clp protease ATP-binding subunit ClpL n=2 Tax=Staphylococcus saprophyticus TaxID=29385 RepID=A0A380HH58_STASA|nr:ATP-dependent Clp protease ATP-binding subunit [Staphylococcus saprophyticus]KIJ86669.1 Clp protease ClpX [Staphylococcus saprophyticus]MBF2780124.1 ATP-dependent Clp protease ATP-binding subunit [Staphylococcus saprophyticus]MBN6091071.1 ATP-dependent Clp protease ATP-binding subunit [Staphylococcus saprophyticus]MBN6093949.1 ATP-dependent Clp protease ATP-binding subunit [Staphylococcus saprophyticus]MBN6097088.1 ATP-dependent Clp protease ATP-binding subunit [Staphylococcus saprophyticus